MRAIKSTGTGIEKILFERAKVFWIGHRYRKHFRIYGIRPDLYFSRAKLAVFVDGDFWHGKDYAERKDRLNEYWQKKIDTNMARDLRQTYTLESQGIRVLRMWGSEILKNPDAVSDRIRELLELGPMEQ